MNLPSARYSQYGRVFLDNLLQHSHRTHLMVWRIHVCQLYHRDTSTPYIRLERGREGERRGGLLFNCSSGYSRILYRGIVRIVFDSLTHNNFRSHPIGTHRGDGGLMTKQGQTLPIRSTNESVMFLLSFSIVLSRHAKVS